MVKLHKHNEETYKKLVSMFAENDRVCAVQPTGTGKSFLILKLIEDNPDKQFLITAPNTYVFGQIKNHAETCNVALENCTFMTYTSLYEYPDLEEIACDYLICDEFHRLGAATWSDGILRFLNTHNCKVLGTSATPIRYLDNARDMAEELFHNNYAVNMTLGEAIAKQILPNPVYIVGMYNFSGEIDELQKRVQRTGDEKLKHRLMGKIMKAKHLVTEQECGLEYIFANHIKSKSAKYIVFCSRIDSLQSIMEESNFWFEKVNTEIHKYYVYSENSRSTKHFEEFQNDNSDALKLLFCVDMLNEGVHVDNIEGVIMLRTTASPNVYFQQLGRSLSANSDRTQKPIIFDIVNNFDNARTGTGVSELIQQFLQFSSEDNEIDFTIYDYVTDIRKILDEVTSQLNRTWDEMFDILCQFLNEYDEFPNTIAEYKGVKIGKWCNNQRNIHNRGELLQDRVDKLNSIGFIWNTLEYQWYEKFYAVKKFYEENGRHLTKKDNPELNNWRISQSDMVRKGKCSPERAKLLRSIGLGLEIPDDDEVWEERLQLYTEFIKQFGRVPKSKELWNGFRIGDWRHIQKRLMRNGKLSEDKIKKLEEVGFTWHREHESWDTLFPEIVEYVKEHGEFPTEEGRLSSFCYRARTDYHNGKLTEEQIRALEELGFIFDRQELKKQILKKQWMESYKKAEQFYIENNGRKPSSALIEEHAVYAWCNKQIKAFKAGKLDEEQIELLEKIKVLDRNQAGSRTEMLWLKRYETFRKFKEEYGRFPFTFDEYEGFGIGQWFIHQKRAFRNGTLSIDRLKKLREIGITDDDFVLERKDDSYKKSQDLWEETYQVLCEFINKFGRMPIAKESYLVFNISAWLDIQKWRLQNGIIAHERMEKLKQIDIDDSIFGKYLEIVKDDDANWDHYFDLLSRYIESKNKLPVYKDKIDSIRIGTWFCRTKKRIESGQISGEKADKICEIIENFKPANQKMYTPKPSKFDDIWIQHFGSLEKFIRENGRLPKKKEYYDDFCLGVWMFIQRRRYQDGLLTEDRIKTLKELNVNGITLNQFFGF